jgi:hypothetical protein
MPPCRNRRTGSARKRNGRPQGRPFLSPETPPYFPAAPKPVILSPKRTEPARAPPVAGRRIQPRTRTSQGAAAVTKAGASAAVRPSPVLAYARPPLSHKQRGRGGTLRVAVRAFTSVPGNSCHPESFTVLRPTLRDEKGSRAPFMIWTNWTFSIQPQAHRTALCATRRGAKDPARTATKPGCGSNTKPRAADEGFRPHRSRAGPRVRNRRSHQPSG